MVIILLYYPLLTELLEKKGYNVYSVDAFQMWSQAIPGEHLYNVIGIKADIDNKRKEPITELSKLETIVY